MTDEVLLDDVTDDDVADDDDVRDELLVTDDELLELVRLLVRLDELVPDELLLVTLDEDEEELVRLELLELLTSSLTPPRRQRK